MRTRKHTIEYLNILGLTGRPAKKEMESRYKDLIKETHPDRFALDHPDRDWAEEKTKDLNQAYSYLAQSSSLVTEKFCENLSKLEKTNKSQKPKVRRPRFNTLYNAKLSSKFGQLKSN